MPRPKQLGKSHPRWTGRRQVALTVAGLCLLVLAVYGQMARGVFPFWPGEQFQFIGLDDGDYVFLNRHIKEGLTADGVRWALVEDFSANWHPLTWISLMLDCEVYGLHPGGPHVTNLLLHLANVLLLFEVLRRMTGRLWPSALVAALFAVHPLHVESVAWVSERKDVLSTFFALAALVAYERYARRPGAGWYLCVLGCYLLSLLSKQMWVTLPFALLLLDYWPLGRWERFGLPPDPSQRYAPAGAVRLVLEKLPLLALALGFSVMIFVVQSEAGAVSSLENMPLGRRIPIVVSSYWIYIAKTLWPARLGVMYPLAESDSLWLPALFCAVPLALVTAAAVAGWRRWPWLAVGWLWYLGTLVPVIGLVQIGSASRADRYAYVPHIGLFLALVWSAAALVAWLQTRYAPRSVANGAAALAAVVLVALTIRGYQQTALWRNTEALFEHTVAVTENNYGMATTLAGYLAGNDRLEDAKKYYRMALYMQPTRIEAMTGCATCIMNNNGKLDEAISLLERAHAIDPKDEFTLIQLGSAYVNKDRFDKGIELIQRVPRQSRKAPLAQVALGMAESRRGNLAAAEKYLRQAVALDPTDATHLRVLGSFYLAVGKFAEAEKLFHEVLEYAPDDLGAQLDLGALMIQRGKIDQAVDLFEQCVRKRPQNADAHNRLAAALMAQGRVAEAMAEFDTAIQLRPDWATPLNDLAWTLATDESPTVRFGQRAVALAQKACEITERKDPAILDTLAAAYAEAGRWEDAVRTAGEAMALAEKKNPNLVAGIDSRRSLYRNHQPVRAPSRLAAEEVRIKPGPATITTVKN